MSKPIQSAQIIQFPIGGRTAAGGPRKAAKAAQDVTTTYVPAAVGGDGWYHEAEMLDADPSRKR